MTSLLPPNLLRLFEPRPPLPYVAPAQRRDVTEVRAKRPEAMSVAAMLGDVREEAALKEAERNAAAEQRDATASKSSKELVKMEVVQEAKKEEEDPAPKEDGEEDGQDDAEMGEVVEDDKPAPPSASLKNGNGSTALTSLDGPRLDDDGNEFTYTEAEKYRLRQLERKRLREENATKALKSYDPQQDREAVGDPYRTLFISRLSYAATEEDLRREFNMYGPIERIRLVREHTGKNKGKSRGYAFILYEREKDMKGGFAVCLNDGRE